MDFDIYLASQSPRRKQLLRQLGVRFRSYPANLEETPQPQEAVRDYVKRLALGKAGYVWDSLEPALRKPVLGADTAVCVDGTILGKPGDRAEAEEMLGLLSGRTHEVVTGVALVSQQHSVYVNVSVVRFRRLERHEIEQYWLTDEPVDKAGGYAIQGFAAAFVEDLHGSFSGVMGLPLFETANLLKQFKIPIWQMENHE